MGWCSTWTILMNLNMITQGNLTKTRMVKDKPKTKLHIKTKKLASLKVLTVLGKKDLKMFTYKIKWRKKACSREKREIKEKTGFLTNNVKASFNRLTTIIQLCWGQINFPGLHHLAYYINLPFSLHSSVNQMFHQGKEEQLEDSICTHNHHPETFHKLLAK